MRTRSPREAVTVRDPVVVTGAASGMGRRLAERWSARGHTVVGIDVQAEPLELLRSQGVLATAMHVDVADAASVRAAVDRIASEHGPIATMVNAAGIIRAGRVDELQPEDFRAVMEVNYLGTVNWVSAVLPGMQSARRGTIVNFASLAGWMPTPITSAYTASKFAVVGFTEALAIELRRSNIHVLGVCPPAVDTPMLEGIRSHPSIPARITRLAPAIPADVVLEAIEEGLARRRLFVFPGPGSTTLWRTRRFAPRLLRAANRLLYGL